MAGKDKALFIAKAKEEANALGVEVYEATTISGRKRFSCQYQDVVAIIDEKAPTTFEIKYKRQDAEIGTDYSTSMSRAIEKASNTIITARQLELKAEDTFLQLQEKIENVSAALKETNQALILLQRIYPRLK